MQGYELLLVLAIIGIILYSILPEKFTFPDSSDCAACFAQCTDDQWRGKIPPYPGTTNKDVCAQICTSQCSWFDEVHPGFIKHGI